MSSLLGFRAASLFAELRRTLQLALPLIGSQLLSMGNGLADALVAGRLGSEALGAMGVAAACWFFTSLLCIGLMAGLSPTLSRMIGERRRHAVGSVFRQGLWLALGVGLLALGILLLIAATLPRWGFAPELVPLMQQYLTTACWSLLPIAFLMVARNTCEAAGITLPVLILQALGLLLNIVIDLLFGLGLYGFPKLGLVGIGLATTAVSVFMAACLLLFLRSPRFSRYFLYERFDRPDWVQLRTMLATSLPIYLGIAFEAGLFTATAIQAGVLGFQEAGAHNIAIGLAGACFMLPLGLSFALTARVGRMYGRRRIESIRLRIAAGLVLALAMATLTALVLGLFRFPLARLYTDDVAVQTLAASLLLMAMVFQFSDGLQVTLIGILRGLDDMRVPMLINAFAYWAVAFPGGVWLAHFAGFGILGLWVGLVGGLTLATLLLGVRLRYRLARVRQDFGSGSVSAGLSMRTS